MRYDHALVALGKIDIQASLSGEVQSNCVSLPRDQATAKYYMLTLRLWSWFRRVFRSVKGKAYQAGLPNQTLEDDA